MTSPSIQLLAEIAFWREMLEADGPAHTDKALERMRNALALAEWKLLTLEQAVAETEHASAECCDPRPASRLEH